MYRWRMCRIFISSTFLDMQAERNLLTRFVFPELRARAERLFVNIRDVDLRWGVSQDDAQSHRLTLSQFHLLAHFFFFVCKEVES